MKWFFITSPDDFHIFTVNLLCFTIKSSRFYNITNYHVIKWSISCSYKKCFHVITWKSIVLTIKVLKNLILERHVGAMVIIYNYLLFSLTLYFICQQLAWAPCRTSVCMCVRTHVCVRVCTRHGAYLLEAAVDDTTLLCRRRWGVCQLQHHVKPFPVLQRIYI